jgi:hypothetical protein
MFSSRSDAAPTATSLASASSHRTAPRTPAPCRSRPPTGTPPRRPLPSTPPPRNLLGEPGLHSSCPAHPPRDGHALSENLAAVGPPASTPPCRLERGDHAGVRAARWPAPRLDQAARLWPSRPSGRPHVAGRRVVHCSRGPAFGLTLCGNFISFSFFKLQKLFQTSKIRRNL